jgi:hypothetical protein
MPGPTGPRTALQSSVRCSGRRAAAEPKLFGVTGGEWFPSTSVPRPINSNFEPSDAPRLCSPLWGPTPGRGVGPPGLEQLRHDRPTRLAQQCRTAVPIFNLPQQHKPPGLQSTTEGSPLLGDPSCNPHHAIRPDPVRYHNPRQDISTQTIHRYSCKRRHAFAKEYGMIVLVILTKVCTLTGMNAACRHMKSCREGAGSGTPPDSHPPWPALPWRDCRAMQCSEADAAAFLAPLAINPCGIPNLRASPYIAS